MPMLLNMMTFITRKASLSRRKPMTQRLRLWFLLMVLLTPKRLSKRSNTRKPIKMMIGGPSRTLTSLAR